MLNVTMHWYWFHMFTILSSFSSGLFREKMSSRLSQYVFSCAKAASTFSAVS